MQLTNDDGDVLWDPKDFGEYSIDKVELIISLLENLLSKTTIKMETTYDDGTLSNIYTKSQSDERFFHKSDTDSVITPLVRDKIDVYLSNTQTVASKSEFDVLKGIVNTLRISCVGLDLEGNSVDSAMSLSSRMTGLDDSRNGKVTTNYNNIWNLSAIIYEIEDGQITSKVKVAYKADVGLLKDLDSSISDRSSLVAAINSLVKVDAGFSKDIETLKNYNSTNDTNISEIKSSLSSLGSTVSTLGESVSTLGDSVSTLSDNQGSLDSLDSSIKDVSSIVAAINSLASAISDLSDRVDALEAASI